MKGRENMNLGNKIMSLRKKNNLSQEELAEKNWGCKTHNIKMGITGDPSRS